MANTDVIPIVDFKSFSTDVASSDNNAATEIYKAFKDIGFVYIINHGIDQNLIKRAYDQADQLFALSSDEKESLARPDNDTNHGWVKLAQESLNPSRPADHKECYNITPAKAKNWPDAFLPDFKNIFLDFYEECNKLSTKILQATAIGLGLSEDYFTKHHNIYTKPNMTSMRCLFYPAIPDLYDIKPGQVRCGEHSDYGSITLLFQDDAGGLEVLPRSGEWFAARPVKDAIIVNIGDMMMRWSADKLVSTRHRVLIPEDTAAQRRQRRSIAFFTQPDDDTVIRCIDGSDKYEPISSVDYLNLRYSVTYSK